MLPDAIKLKIKNSAVIAVVTIDDSSNAVPLAESLIKGGVTVMELTLRSESAMDSLRLIIEQVPEMTAGVGTVLRVDQLEEIIAVGAEFGVAPGLNPKIIQRRVIQEKTAKELQKILFNTMENSTFFFSRKLTF